MIPGHVYNGPYIRGVGGTPSLHACSIRAGAHLDPRTSRCRRKPRTRRTAVAPPLEKGYDLFFRLHSACFVKGLLPFDKVDYSVSPLFLRVPEFGVVPT